MTSPGILFYHRIFPIKNIFANKIVICKLIFTIFAAHFTTNLVLNIDKKLLIIPENPFSEVKIKTLV